MTDACEDEEPQLLLSEQLKGLAFAKQVFGRLGKENKGLLKLVVECQQSLRRKRTLVMRQTNK